MALNEIAGIKEILVRFPKLKTGKDSDHYVQDFLLKIREKVKNNIALDEVTGNILKAIYYKSLGRPEINSDSEEEAIEALHIYINKKNDFSSPPAMYGTLLSLFKMVIKGAVIAPALKENHDKALKDFEELIITGSTKEITNTTKIIGLALYLHNLIKTDCYLRRN